MWIMLAAALSIVHVEGDVTADGGDYVDVPFAVPAGTAEIQIIHTDGSEFVILDWGVFGPSGFRGWSGGLTEDIVIGVEQSSRGYLPGPIEPGTWTLSIGKAQLEPSGGHYIVDITCNPSATLPVLPKAPYQPIVMATGRRWYKGDFHVHSEQSGDARATLQQNIDLAHSRGLDFINLSDHNTTAQHALVAAQQPSWPVLVLRSSEITTYAGHGNGVGIHDYVDHRLGYLGRTMQGVIDDVVAQGGAFIINHPATDLGASCIGCAWKPAGDVPWDEIAGLEILTAGYDLGERVFTPSVIAMWDALEDQGHRLSAVSGSDDHTAGGGTNSIGGSDIGRPTALVLATELSEAAIVDALRHQRTKVQLRGPDDPDVDFAVKTAGGTLADIGDDVDGIARVEMPVHVTGGDGMFVQVWRDGDQLTQIAVTGHDFTATAHDVPGAGDHRYRIELIDDLNRRVVVTSHIYVHAIDASGGCGCRASSGLGGAFPVLAMALPWRARRRRARRDRP
jgi:hypothetical protein